MLGKTVNENQKKYVLQSWNKQAKLDPIPIEKADNIYLYDYDGKRYSDMSSLHVNMNLGYGNKEINEAIKNKIDQGATFHHLFRISIRNMEEELHILS